MTFVLRDQPTGFDIVETTWVREDGSCVEYVRVDELSIREGEKLNKLKVIRLLNFLTRVKNEEKNMEKGEKNE